MLGSAGFLPLFAGSITVGSLLSSKLPGMLFCEALELARDLPVRGAIADWRMTRGNGG